MNVIVNGALGRMGQQVCRLLAESGDTAIRVDRVGGDGVYAALSDYDGPADAVIAEAILRERENAAARQREKSEKETGRK